jgi:hypothetical protein
MIDFEGARSTKFAQLDDNVPSLALESQSGELS